MQFMFLDIEKLKELQNKDNEINFEFFQDDEDFIKDEV